jgi:hypothetical protein
MAVFWDVAPSSLVHINRRFREAYCHHHHGDDGGSKLQKMETAVFAESLENFQLSTRLIPEGQSCTI